MAAADPVNKKQKISMNNLGLKLPRGGIKHWSQSDGFDFYDDPKARALIRMPGCYAAFVNRAHNNSFNARFPIVHNLGDIEMELKKQTEICRKANANEKLFCYPYPLGSVILLSTQDCVFSRAFKNFAHQARADDWVSDIVVTKIRQDSTERKYQLYKVKCRKVRFYDVDYIEVVYFKLLGLTVTVETIKFSKNGAAKNLRATTSLNGEPFMDEIIVDVEQAKDYNIVYSMLADAFQDVSSGEMTMAELHEKVLAKIKSHGRVLDKSAVSGFFNGIFTYVCGPAEESKSRLDIEYELKRAQQRLFDTDIVVNKVKELILRRMSKWKTVDLF